ncbi:D-apionate lactonase [Sphingomonas sp. DT-204]|uniref:D-apionate lactonase n=1 Tax=Sphingomonas sp. DT-204 TaxID=3396166 RepID=UPI003F19D3CB
MSGRAEELYGTDEPEPQPLRLAAGPLSFELVGGNIRSVRVGGSEVLRGIQYLVRDRDWGTLAPAISDLVVKEGPEGITVAYRASVRGDDGAMLGYAATIRATATGLDFIVEAVAEDDFTTNRLGFCVLHPAGLAGAPLTVEHGGGSIERSAFPTRIEPWQPFTDIRALIHRQDGAAIACRLDGDDAFEMEDQRNWSDASYKTYIRPLARPWPYVVPAGTLDRQSVKVAIEGSLSAAPQTNGPITITPGDPIGTMPRIGLVVTPAEAAAGFAQAKALRSIAPQDLLLTFEAHAGHGAAEMAALAEIARILDARITLECVIAAADLDAELGLVADHVARAGLKLDALSVFPAPDLQSTPPGSEWPACPPLEQVYAAARRAFPGAALGGGMFGYFTELNRKRPPLAPLDYVTHATCPIVHAADDLSVMQTLEAIPHIVRSARAIIGAKPYRLGPVTIGMRQNPYGSRTMDNPDRRRIPMAQVDPRQDGRFAAAWTLGYVAASEEASLDALTPGALTGPFGLLGDNGPRPVFATVRSLAALAGAPRRSCRSSAPERVLGIATDRTILLANITADSCEVRIEGTAHRLTLDAYETMVLPTS